MVTKKSTGADGSVRITGRHSLDDHQPSQHAAVVVFRLTGDVPPRFQSPRHELVWPTFEGDLDNCDAPAVA